MNSYFPASLVYLVQGREEQCQEAFFSRLFVSTLGFAGEAWVLQGVD